MNVAANVQKLFVLWLTGLLLVVSQSPGPQGILKRLKHVEAQKHGAPVIATALRHAWLPLASESLHVQLLDKLADLSNNKTVLVVITLRGSPLLGFKPAQFAATCGQRQLQRGTPRTWHWAVLWNQ